jgi:hypothetical protein
MSAAKETRHIEYHAKVEAYEAQIRSETNCVLHRFSVACDAV